MLQDTDPRGPKFDIPDSRPDTRLFCSSSMHLCNLVAKLFSPPDILIEVEINMPKPEYLVSMM